MNNIKKLIIQVKSLNNEGVSIERIANDLNLIQRLWTK